MDKVERQCERHERLVDAQPDWNALLDGSLASIIAAVEERQDRKRIWLEFIPAEEGGFTVRWHGLSVTTEGDSWTEALTRAFDAGLECCETLSRERVFEKVLYQEGWERDGSGGWRRKEDE